jgi:hypothetical protein
LRAEAELLLGISGPNPNTTGAFILMMQQLIWKVAMRIISRVSKMLGRLVTNLEKKWRKSGNRKRVAVRQKAIVRHRR